ncbi:MAG: MoaD/ThiS family protein [Paracoccaceae bacterium]|nr:MoaD/ThiS family protein [Paracoccaceae bacterium]
MVKVKIWGSLVEATGFEYVNVEGTNFIELLENLQLKYPGLRPQIQRGVSLAIDGKIYKESWFTPIRKDSEVVLMPFMIGG